jgi:hypothetical protein
MLKQKYFLSAVCLAAIVLGAACAARAQKPAETPATAPDLSVAGVRLGNRATAKAFLEGFQPRISEDARPAYYFYNRSATQVLKLTGASFDDRFLIVEIEVYKVGKSYTAPHFQNDKIGFFKTESDIFVGYKQSTASAITGIPNVDGKDRTGPKTVAKKLGAPTDRLTEGERETLIYELPEIEIADETGKTAKFAYSARYEFNDDKLKRFVLKISPVQGNETK